MPGPTAMNKATFESDPQDALGCSMQPTDTIAYRLQGIKWPSRKVRKSGHSKVVSSFTSAPVCVSGFPTKLYLRMPGPSYLHDEVYIF